MEKPYLFFDTPRGCLAGLALSAAYAVVAVLILLYLPVGSWPKRLIILAVGVPMLAPAFWVDRRTGRRGGD